MILTGKKPDIIGNLPGEVPREGDRVGAGDGLPADFDFSAPLTHNLILERGTGTATFARTTTGFIQDNENIYNLIDIAAARFKGARYLGSGIFSNLDSIGDLIFNTTLKGILIENQRTNLILRSRDYDDPAWAKVGTQLRVQDQVGIDAQANKAWTVTDNDITSISNIRQDISIPADLNTVTGYIFIKKDNDETRFPAFRMAGFVGATLQNFVQINTKTGAIITTVSSGIIDSGVIDIGDWWLLWASIKNDGTITVLRVRFNMADSTTWGVSEVAATGSVVIDQIQFEINSTFFSSPIETIASSVTRTLDLLQYPVSGNVENNNISCFIKWTPAQDDLETVFIWASYVDVNNYTALLHDGTDLIIRKRIAGVNNDASIILDYDNNVTYKIGWRFSELDGIDIWLDGIKGTNDSDTADLQLGTNFEIGSDGNGANHDFSYHKENEIWNRTLSDSEMAAFTS